jgi:hypothetical protein
MIPSGYKEDVVYSQIPTNGNGDLSFTRASNGTRVNSAGLVEVCPWNLLVSSQSFTTSGGDWNYTAGSGVTTGQTGYDGTTNAVLFTDSGANGDYGAYQVISQLGSQTFSIYAKAGSVSSFAIDIYQTPTPRVIVNLSNGTITSGSGVIESVGNGWYRISVTAVMTTTYYVRFGCTVAGNVYIQNAQLNIGSTTKPYFPTTDRLNVPRLTYQNGGGGCPSLLLEKQSTNVLTYSEQFDQWNTQDASVTANQITSPDGTQNADKIVENNQNQAHYVYSNTGTYASADYTVSVYAKAGERSILQLLFNGSTNINAFANFDLTNGVAYPTSSTATITAVGNGWYRCTITATLAAATLPLVYFAIQTSTSATRAQAYAGNGTSGLYLWGAQSEQSSYVTSLINTTSASATRVADACSKTGISSLIGQTSGTMFVDFIAKGSYDSNNLLMLISTGSGGDIIYLNLVSGTIEAYIAASSTQQFLYNGGTVLTANTRHKLAIGYANNDIVLYHNGTQLATDTSASIPACTLLRVGDFLGGIYQFGNSINQAILFPTRLTNAELASLTTL